MTGTQRPCLHPRANHQHGTYLAFLRDGCHCDPCTTAHRTYAKRSAHATVTGTHTYTDANRARTRVQVLLANGLTIGQIEQRSGVHRTAIRVLIGDFPGRPASKRITKTTHAALLAVNVDRVGTEQSGLVDPTGTRRRLQALMTIGWPARHLATRLHMSSATIPALTYTKTHKPVLASTRASVIDLYDELALQVPPPSRVTTRVKNIASARGWHPPLVWDDDTIDDPGSSPATGDTTPIDDVDEANHIDDVAISRGMAGDRTIRLTKHEKYELTARWQNTGRPLNELERVTGLNARRYITRTQEAS